MRRLILMLCLLVLGVSTMNAQDQSLVTRWAAEVDSNNVLPEYPRPQLVRDNWQNLNGLWDYAVTGRNDKDIPTTFDGQILVPFPIESALSGVHKQIKGQNLWYRRSFVIPEGWGDQRVLLHFGAVDWETIVWVNNQQVVEHRGGYDPFSADITDALTSDGEQEIIVFVWDPTEGTQPRGKQVFNPDAIWYTPTTGIWQTVWLEPVPTVSIAGLKLETDIDQGLISVQAMLNDTQADSAYRLTVDVLEGETVVASGTGVATQTVEISIENPKLWSPDSPFLYDLRVTLSEGAASLDEVTSYVGMRKISLEADENGVQQLMLNNEPLFQFGLLDQGFWPDGLYTAPTDEALRSDIEVTKELGFNLIRKHVKVEPLRWYYWADRLGVLVWQDMPSGDRLMGPGEGEMERSEKSAAQFELELQRMIDTLKNQPSIVMWVIFNEGWGQYDTARVTEWLEGYDVTRLVNSVSGWTDMGVGDVYDIHSYPGPDAPPTDPKRASVLGEFGGLGLPIADHTWLSQDNWGYRQYTTQEELLEAYTALIEKLKGLKETRGLVAAIYTQTTDVETEVNGMLTYDREIIKLSPDVIRPLNESLYQED